MTSTVSRLPFGLALLALAGAVVAVEGGVWDDAWHTDRGRDSFFIAPHLALYGGVTCIGAALTLWVLRAARAAGLREVLRQPALKLAIISLAFTLASAPVDNAWHAAFGRDAVIWSPPHMLGIAGMLALGVALLTQLRGRPVLFAAGSGLLIAAATFPAIEYETDVPQFAARWYLPVLGTGIAFAFALLRHLDHDRRLVASRAAVAHLVLFGALAAFLATQGFPVPALPLVIAPALATDWITTRGGGAVSRALCLTAVLFLAYVPVRNLVGDGVELSTEDILLGIPLTLGAVLAVEALVGGRFPWRPAALPIALAALLAVVPSALAHDPGQGDPAGTMRLRMDADGGRVQVAGVRPGCGELRGGTLTARRAGAVRHAPLQTAGCRMEGRLTVPGRGRWFVYVDVSERGRTVEAWLPIHVGGRDQIRDDARFAYHPNRRSPEALKLIAGVVIYLLMAGLLAATALLARRSVRPAYDGA